MSDVMLGPLVAVSLLKRLRLWVEDAIVQFQGLNTSNPSSWPVWPRVLLCIAVVLGIWLLAGYGPLRWRSAEWGRLEHMEVQLRTRYIQQVAEAVNLKPLQLQRQRASLRVQRLEGHILGALEMANTLTVINQLGLAHDLHFEWFRPEHEVVHDFYVEQPVSVRISGSFDNIATFASDLAHLPHIVILDSIVLLARDGSGQTLVLDAMVRTYRRLHTDAMSAVIEDGAAP